MIILTVSNLRMEQQCCKSFAPLAKAYRPFSTVSLGSDWLAMVRPGQVILGFQGQNRYSQLPEYQYSLDTYYNPVHLCQVFTLQQQNLVQDSIMTYYLYHQLQLSHKNSAFSSSFL